MTNEILLSLTILLVMIIIMFILLKKIVESVNHNSKESYILKLQEYNDLLEEKERLKETEEKTIKEKEEVEMSISDANDIVVEKQPEYQIDNFLELAKKVNEKFNLNNEEIIKSFLNLVHQNNYDKKDLINYKIALNLKKSIDKKGLYNIITSDEKDKEKTIKELKNIGKLLIENYLKIEKEFDFASFYEYLKDQLKENDSTIYIEVGEEKLDYHYIDDSIKTIYNKNIYKGIIIIYRNKMYDYSLKF